MEYLSSCPVCNESVLAPFLSCRDYTVSHETFQLEKCMGCGLVITNPRPEEQHLGRYYQSDAYISHSDESRSAVDHLYKVARNFTLRWKYNLLVKYSEKKPTELLDYGCGTGAFLQECQRHGMLTWGVEPSDTARAQARTKTPNVHGTLDEVHHTYDAITLWHVLEHISTLNQTLDALAARLDQNGSIFIAVPNLQSHDAAHYREHWAAYDVPRHLWHFSRNTMQKLLTRHGLNLIKVAPMPLDAFYVSLLSEKYRRGNLTPVNVMKALVEGSVSNLKARKSLEYSSLIYIARK